MKNIHIFPTDKPTRLFTSDSELTLAGYPKTTFKTGKNIYITNDEKPKLNDWFLDTIDKVVFKVTHEDILTTQLDGLPSNFKKIILTTDQDLIKDGVQPIPDEFLEWFVKNPSCESVEIIDDTLTVGEMSKLPLGTRNHKYKIIIPKEEPKFVTVDVESANGEDLGKISYIPLPGVDYTPKQETLEEVANKANGYNVYAKETKAPIFNEGFIAGAKWQQENTNVNALNFEIDSLKRQVEALKHQKEQMYSEEEFLSFGKSCFYKGFEKSEKDDANCYTAFREEIGSIIEQFKNKKL